MNLNLFMALVSDWGPAIPLLCMLLTADKKIIARGIASILLTWGVTQPLKLIVARPRPFTVGAAPLIGKAPEGFSFPSQHAGFSFTMATTTELYRRTLGIIALLSAALVAYSRVYLGVHYWTDIIAGAILGSIVAYIVDKVFSHYEKKHPKKR